MIKVSLSLKESFMDRGKEEEKENEKHEHPIIQ